MTWGGLWLIFPEISLILPSVSPNSGKLESMAQVQGRFSYTNYTRCGMVYDILAQNLGWYLVPQLEFRMGYDIPVSIGCLIS